MAKPNDTRAHVCQHCGGEFPGRKRKFCPGECAHAHKRERDRVRSEVKRRAKGVPTKQTEISPLRGTPIYKRIQRFRQARREGRVQAFKPLPQERAIYRAYLARRKAWRSYLSICKRIDNRGSGKWAGMTSGEIWSHRYRNEPKFRAAQKERLLAKKQRRRHDRKLRSDGTVTADTLGRAQDCLYCGEELNDTNRTIDHMVPLNKGGWHSASNVVECCRSCNSSKSDMDYPAWLDRIDQRYRFRAEREYIARHGSHPRQMGFNLILP